MTIPQLTAFLGLAVVSIDPFGALLALACFRRDPRRRATALLVVTVIAGLWLIALLAGHVVAWLLGLLRPWLSRRPVEEGIQLAAVLALLAVAGWQWWSSRSEPAVRRGPTRGRLGGIALAGLGFALVSVSDPGLLVAATSAQLTATPVIAGALMLLWVGLYQLPLLAVGALLTGRHRARRAARIDRFWTRIRRPAQRGLAILLLIGALALLADLALAVHLQRLPALGRLLG